MTRNENCDSINETKTGQTEPPQFIFQPLRISVQNDLLQEGCIREKLLTVVAPVGYGKTVLLSMLFDELQLRGKQCLWLGLDERDTSIDSVVSTLFARLKGSDTGIRPTQALFLGNESLEVRIEILINLIDHYPLPITLFIDNLNCCEDPALGILLDKLIFSTRLATQLVLSSTHEIPIDLSRASLEGLIRPINHAQLSFNETEVGIMLGESLCLRIGTEGVREVTCHTEGWPAAVRMAQIVLSESEEPLTALASFSGSDEGIAHLLNRQVFSTFPPDVRELLLSIAMLRNFNLDLCVQAADSEKAKDVLGYLLERNAFVIPLDRNRNWYRLHGLFREYLHNEAARQLSTQQRQEILERAARWCEDNRYWREAIDYALQSGCYDMACRVLEHSAPAFVCTQGDMLQYIKWLEVLHEHNIQAGPEAEYCYVWALVFRRRYEDARQQSSKLVQRILSGNKDSDDLQQQALQRRISIQHISIDSLSDRLSDAHQGATHWLSDSSATQDDAFNLSAAHCIEACYYCDSLQFIKAREAIQLARESAFQANSPYVDGWVSAYAALIPVYEGDYANAYPELVSALASARSQLGDMAGICGTLALIAAKCAIEMGLESDARQLIQLGVQSSRTHGFLEAAACGIETAVLLWSDDEKDPVTLAYMRDVASSYPPRLSLMLSCFLIRRLLQLDRKNEALAEAARIGLNSADTDPIQNHGDIVQLEQLLATVKIELMIATGHSKQAGAIISVQSKKAKALGCIVQLVELELIQMSLALHEERIVPAYRHLTRAISMATSRRIVRPFYSSRNSLISLLKKQDGQCVLVSKEEQRFFDELSQGLSVQEKSSTAVTSNEEIPADAPCLIGHLTPRELEILHLIHAGLTNQQIADRTEVSLTTIKWHLQNLYGKLSVSSRSAALAKARELDLLH